MRAALLVGVALWAALASAGCAAFAPPVAELIADDAGKAKEIVAVRFTLRNVGEGALDVDPSQFRVVGGVGFFRCSNEAAGWRLTEPRAPETADDAAPTTPKPTSPSAASMTPGRAVRAAPPAVALEPGEDLTGYLRLKLCPDVAGPYSLAWSGDGKGEAAEARMEIRILDARSPLDPVTQLARYWDEDQTLTGEDHVPAPPGE